MPYTYTNAKGTAYYLYNKLVTLRSGREQLIYFFSPAAQRHLGNNEQVITDLPEGFEVVENSRTGLPVLRRA